MINTDSIKIVHKKPQNYNDITEVIETGRDPTTGVRKTTYIHSNGKTLSMLSRWEWNPTLLASQLASHAAKGEQIS